jgi:predicted alpha/beta superfamily hydrolase
MRITKKIISQFSYEGGARCFLIVFLLSYSLRINSQDADLQFLKQTEFRPHPYTGIWGGEKKDTLIYSNALGYAKNITIFTPRGYGNRPGEMYPVIITFDRNGIELTNFLLHSVDILEMAGQIPRSLVVSIESGGEPGDRTKEARWGIDGKGAYGEKFDQFMFDELIPLMTGNYLADINQVIIYGHSWFGYHTAMILKDHIPDLLGVISASPCCLNDERIDEIVKAVKECDSLKHKFFLRIASGHDIGDDLDVYRKLTGGLSLVRLPGNFDYKTTWYSAAMHMEVPALMFIQSLYEIYSDWADLGFAYSDPGNCPTFDDARLYDSLQALSDLKYGFRIPFSDRHIDWRVEYYRYIRDEKVTLEGRIATWKFKVSRYGETPELYFNIASNYQLLGLDDQAKYYIGKCWSLDPDDGLRERLRRLEKGPDE